MMKTRAKFHSLIILVVLSMLGGCATTANHSPPLLPEQFKTKTGPYEVSTTQPLATDDAVVKQLVALRTQVEETLGVHVEPGDYPIKVYILPDRKTYDQFLKARFPELPQRRAFFLANGEGRTIYTFKGERLEEDIRHEATHALLNLAVGEIPLWLDEGLAEYFEVISLPAGLNREHLTRLPRDAEEGWKPDLTRLEALKSVTAMTPRDYREAWSWVHFMLNESTEGRAALLGYLADLHRSPTPVPLSERLRGTARDRAVALNAHLTKLAKSGQIQQSTMTAASALDSAVPTLRLQNGTIEIEPIEPLAPKKRGFFARMMGRLFP